MAGGGAPDATLEFTPTWVVAAVCFVMVSISLIVERLIHATGKLLKKKNKRTLFEALEKVKEELMLLGFISLMLTVFQGRIVKICVPDHFMEYFLPCSNTELIQTYSNNANKNHRRRLLDENGDGGGAEESQDDHGGGHVGFGDEINLSYCKDKHKAPLLTVEAVHHLHIFIFVLAIVHVLMCLLTVLFGMLKIRQWKAWEEDIEQEYSDNDISVGPKYNNVNENDFVLNRFVGWGKRSAVYSWMDAFTKQFKGTIYRTDYEALRLGFIMTHCRGNPKFNFYKYMVRALEHDFKKVVGISWYLWVFVVIFLLLNLHGWHFYFWIAFVPLILLLLVGTKLEHVISELAHEVAEKHAATVEGEMVVQPSDNHFWFKRPQLFLFFIHIILFQNAFEIAFLFWIWVQYGFDSCMMGELRYVVPRLVIGVFIQVVCSYSTLPIYAIVTQMGSHFKKSIFDESIATSLVGWAQNAKKRAKEATLHEHLPAK